MKMLGKPVVAAAALVTLFSAGGNAANWTPPSGTIVQWESIIGIVAPGNAVAGIAGITGTGVPWSTLGGQVRVDLTTATAAFEVRGLVQAGGNAIGTPGTVTQIAGTLICNPGGTNQVVVSTPPVTLDAQGNASFNGSFSGSASTDTCVPTSVAFLITVPNNGAVGNWIANGTVPGAFSPQSWH